MTWQRFVASGGKKHPSVIVQAARAAEAGEHIALYCTPERGWYGWHSPTVPSGEVRHLCHPVRGADDIMRAIPEANILKAADQIRMEAPDEIGSV